MGLQASQMVSEPWLWLSFLFVLLWWWSRCWLSWMWQRCKLGLARPGDSTLVSVKLNWSEIPDTILLCSLCFSLSIFAVSLFLYLSRLRVGIWLTPRIRSNAQSRAEIGPRVFLPAIHVHPRRSTVAANLSPSFSSSPPSSFRLAFLVLFGSLLL